MLQSLLLLRLLVALHVTAFAFALADKQPNGNGNGSDAVLKLAVFGGANAWGSGVHLDNRFQAFPYLLEGYHVDNYASVSSGAANYAAVCLASIIGAETIYDVILLDFSHAVNSNVRKLAQRLRQRYPQAIIIFVKYWRPLQIQRSSPVTQFDSVDLPTWMQQRGLTDWKSNDFQTRIQADDGIWFDQHHQDGMTNLLNDYASGVNAFVVDLGDISKDVKQGLVDNMRYFDRLTLLSQEGHTVLAEHIQTVIHEQNISANTTTTTTTSSAADSDATILGDFGGGDFCNIWVTTGEIDTTTITHRSDGMNEFQRGKYSLEFSQNGAIHFTNPFPEKRRVFLSFLVSNTDGWYPQTRVHASTPPLLLRGGGDNSGLSIDLNPVGSQYHAATAEYVKTVPLGFVLPGAHTLFVGPDMETGSNQPFRIVGLTIGNERVAPDVYDFVSLFSH